MDWSFIISAYIVGFFTCYAMCKVMRGNDPDCNQWVDVFLTIIYSLTSWIAVFVLLVVSIIYMLVDSLEGIKIKDIFKNKPPTWM